MSRHVWLAVFGLCSAGCTLYVFTQLNGKGGSNNTTTGGCFNLPTNQCGKCIAQQCEVPDGSPPVSLAQVCSFDPNAGVVTNTTACANQPDIFSNDCTSVFQEGGAYSPTIDSQGAAENNLKKCITDKCVPSCTECLVNINTCGGAGTVAMADAGTCGACLDQAMNVAGSNCQQWVLQGGCVEDPFGAIAKCAGTGTQCQIPDCTGLSAPDVNLIDAGYALYQCLWGACSSVCP